MIKILQVQQQRKVQVKQFISPTVLHFGCTIIIFADFTTLWHAMPPFIPSHSHINLSSAHITHIKLFSFNIFNKIIKYFICYCQIYKLYFHCKILILIKRFFLHHYNKSVIRFAFMNIHILPLNSSSNTFQNQQTKRKKMYYQR